MSVPTTLAATFPVATISIDGSLHSALALALAWQLPWQSALPWQLADGGVSSPLHLGALNSTEHSPEHSPEHCTLALASTAQLPRHSPEQLPWHCPLQSPPAVVDEQAPLQVPVHVPLQVPSQATARFAEPSHVPEHSASHLPASLPGSQRSAMLPSSAWQLTSTSQLASQLACALTSKEQLGG